MKVDGATMLITGASSGIGAALARAASSRGARVALVARRRDRLEEVLADCQQHVAGSTMRVADLGDVDLAERVALETWDELGHLDVLVNNAAMPKRRHATRLSPEEVERVMRVNFFSPARMTLALLPRMLERGSGTIVNVSSLGGRLGIPREAAYCASKFALCGWSEALHTDLAGTGVSIRLINPGAIDTEIWEQPDNERPMYDGPKETAESVAEGILAAIEGESFEHYLPDMKAIVEMKTSGIDDFLAGVASMADAQDAQPTPGGQEDAPA